MNNKNISKEQLILECRTRKCWTKIKRLSAATINTMTTRGRTTGPSRPTKPNQSKSDPGRDEKRRLLAEAAEKRRSAAESRGVQNVESVRRAKERQLTKERQEELAARNPQTDVKLRWQMM